MRQFISTKQLKIFLKFIIDKSIDRPIMRTRKFVKDSKQNIESRFLEIKTNLRNNKRDGPVMV
jgi:hypothetical protein